MTEPVKRVRVRDKGDRRAQRLRYRFGIEPEQYDALADVGHGRCWVCQEPERIAGRALAVDHCHESMAIRGLLCTRCNQVLGKAGDNPQLLRALADYLERPPTGLVAVVKEKR